MLRNIASLIFASAVLATKLILTGIFLAIGFSLGSLIFTIIKKKLQKRKETDIIEDRPVVERIIF